MMIHEIKNTQPHFVGKIFGIFQDHSLENQEKANEFFQFLTEHPEIEGPKIPFVFSIFRDSIVSDFLQNKIDSLEEIILKKAPYLKDYPEQLETLLFISQNDLIETLKHR